MVLKITANQHITQLRLSAFLRVRVSVRDKFKVRIRVKVISILGRWYSGTTIRFKRLSYSDQTLFIYQPRSY